MWSLGVRSRVKFSWLPLCSLFFPTTSVYFNVKFRVFGGEIGASNAVSTAVQYLIHALRNVFQVIKFANDQAPATVNSGLISKGVKQGIDVLNWTDAKLKLESSTAPTIIALEAKDLDKPLTESFNRFEKCHNELESRLEEQVRL